MMKNSVINPLDTIFEIQKLSNDLRNKLRLVCRSKLYTIWCVLLSLTPVSIYCTIIAVHKT